MASSIVTYYPGGLLPSAPAQNKAEQWDDGAQTYTAWDPSGNVTTTRPYTAAEIAAAQAAQAAATATANQSTLQARAQAALTTNSNYLAIATPTNAQVVAQVQAITKECSAVIRLLLGVLDSTSGT